MILPKLEKRKNLPTLDSDIDELESSLSLGMPDASYLYEDPEDDSELSSDSEFSESESTSLLFLSCFLFLLIFLPLL